MDVQPVSSTPKPALMQIVKNQLNEDLTLYLPDEALIEIFERLSFLQLNRVSHVCRRWYNIATSNYLLLSVFQKTVQRIQEVIIPSFIVDHLNERLIFNLSRKTTLATGKWARHPLTKQSDITLQGSSLDPDQICFSPDVIFYARKLPCSNFSLNLELETKGPLLKRKVALMEEATQHINTLMEKKTFAPGTKEVMRLMRKPKHG